MRTRYLLVEPLVALASAGDTAAATQLGALLAHDGEGAVRAHAAEQSGGVSAVQDALILAVRDPEPRVREAALHAIATAHAERALEAAGGALASDSWTFVRTSAAIALASFRPAAATDRALADAMKDASPNVRSAAVAGLALHRATPYRDRVRARLDDETEELDVRVTAARALGPLCDKRSLDRLTSLAREGAAPGATETDTLLGLAATDAIGAIHPADIAARLLKVRGKDARPDARRAVDRALAEPGMCRGGP
jgi:HEAT repeat protein